MRRWYVSVSRRRVRASDVAVTLAILFSVAWVGAYLTHQLEESVEGDANVVDGDTVTILGRTIRLRGIDAPERDQYCMEGTLSYPCGARSAEALRELVAGGALQCVGDEEDRYGRLLAVCMVGDTDINATMVRAGWAAAYGSYEAEEAVARREAAGLWAGTFEMPREWRARHGLMADIGAAGAALRMWNTARRAIGFGGEQR